MIDSILYPKRKKASTVRVTMKYEPHSQLNWGSEDGVSQPVIKFKGIVAVRTKTKHYPTDDDERSDNLY